MEIYNQPQNRMRKARALSECYWTIKDLQKTYKPIFDTDTELNGLVKQLSDAYDALVDGMDEALIALVDHGSKLRIEMEFDPEKVSALGYTVWDIHRTIKCAFGEYNLPCVLDYPLLVITDRGHKDDWSHMWFVIMNLTRSKTDWGPGRMMVCSCGRVALDPAVTMYRIVGLKRDAEWEDCSEPWVDCDEHIPTTVTIAAMEEATQMRLQHNMYGMELHII